MLHVLKETGDPWMWRQRRGHLLGGGLGACRPKEIFGILDVLRLHAVSASRIEMIHALV